MNDRQTTLDGLQAQVADVQATAAASAAVATQTQAHLAAITSAASGRMAWDGLLDQLSRVMPPGTSLESLQGTNAAPAVAGAHDCHFDAQRSRDGRGAHRLRRHRLRAFAGDGGARARPARAHPGALRRNAPVDAARRRRPKKALQFTIGANVRSAGGTPR